ncbi:MAG: S8/S53 family peptidase [Bacteroidota bacterium]
MTIINRFVTILIAVLAIASIGISKGIVDSRLQQKLSAEPGPFQVIVTFKHTADVSTITSLGVPYLALQQLPMCGALLTKEQINAVLNWENVESVYFNEPLKYFNYVAGEVTGAHYVQDVLKYKGKGSTILVLDSGVDAAHPDLPFRTKVIENVKVVSDLGLTGTSAFTEGVINTDNTSGHGTHVAGTVAGTGAASAADERNPYYYRGVAPEASLVGVGAGEGLSILSALVGFDYAIATKDRFGTSVITNSWGNSTSEYDPNNPISKASYEAYRKGIVVTFAAGNDGPDDNTMSTYSINPWVIGVAAGTKAKDLAGFSSRGEATEPYEHPDLTAPGVSIISTRALGTPVGALGPVVDVNHPSYYTYYASLSGTSMATPFVAGSVALLLNANPQLSPDQIEEILTSTTDPMPGYQVHQVGTGYINVRAAVEKALTIPGNRVQFLSGDTKWSSQGAWTIAEDNNSDLGYFGTWKVVENQNASGGSYKTGFMKVKGKRIVQRPSVHAVFFGTSVKVGYPTNNEGGVAEVFIDGVSHGKINYYSDTPQWDVRSAFAGLGNTNHTIEIRGLTGKIYLDNLYLDGKIFPNNTEFVDESQTYTGSIGPSVEGIPETKLIPFDVADNTIQISAELGWSGGVDVDFYLIDPNGNEVTSGATLENPEVLTYWVTEPGTYTYKVVGYATVLANYTLTSTQTKAVVSQQSAFQKSSSNTKTGKETSAAPSSISLSQNYPNPFNPVTTITYSLPERQNIRIKIYDLLGLEVATVADGVREAGTHTIRFNASNLPTGMYFYRFETETGYTTVRRMLLIK